MNTQQNNSQNHEADILGMSDEELLKLNPSQFYEEEVIEDEGTDIAWEQNEDSSEEAEEVLTEQENTGPEEDVNSEGDGFDEEGSEEPDEENSQEPELYEDEEESAEEVEEEDSDSESDSPEIDYKAEYEKIFAPFKANGREFRIERAEDAITLMQMGANYNKKMAALKPNLRLLKMLEKNDLLDEQKLSYLIDLDKKNPEAISKLISESGLDPMDLDETKASGYTPGTYTVDEREIELDAVIDSIKDSPVYPRVVEVVGNKWDQQSQRIIAENPQVLQIINSHMESGVYDIIEAEMAKERAFGRLTGLSDIEAYRQIGDAIHARGGFDHLVGRQDASPQTERKVVKPKSERQNKTNLRNRKRAASSTKPAAPSRPRVDDFNPLNMSDEEFSKLVHENLL